MGGGVGGWVSGLRAAASRGGQGKAARMPAFSGFTLGSIMVSAGKGQRNKGNI